MYYRYEADSIKVGMLNNRWRAKYGRRKERCHCPASKSHGRLRIKHQVRKVHCIIHQEALCAKYSNFKDVMDVMVRAVNLILSRGLKHRQFQQLLSEAETQYRDLLYFCKVCWLSQDAMLERVYAAGRNS